MKKTIALILALVMAFSLAACGGNDAGPTDPIKVGHIADLTGTDYLTGKQAQEAVDFAVQYIGEISGREVQVFHADSQSNAANAADAARKLIEENEVDVLVGPTMIGHKMAVATVAASYEVPVIFYNPTPTVPDIMANEWVIGAAGSNPQMPTVMADYVYNELGYTKVATLTKDDSGGTSYMDPFKEYFEALGGTVVEQSWVPNDSTDYASYLVPIANSDAECLVAWTSGSAAFQFWGEWDNTGLSSTLPVVAVFHGAFTDSFICDGLNETSPELVKKIVGTNAPMTWAYNIDTPENNAFVEAWKEAHDGQVPVGNNLPGAAVQVMVLLKAAVESLDGDTSDSAALRDALLASDITGPEGRTVFEGGSNMAIKSVFVVEVVQLEDGSYNYGLVKEYADVPVMGLTAN